MNTTTLKERLGLDEEAVFEDGVTATDDGMTDEELKIESLKIATNIGKLMSNVTTEDIVSIAETVAKFIKGGEGASLETTNDDSSSDEDDGSDDEQDTNKSKYEIKEINYNGEEYDVNQQNVTFIKSDIAVDKYYRVEFEKNQDTGVIYRAVINVK